MIRGDVPRAADDSRGDKPFVFTARNASSLFRDVAPGSLVRVTVISARADGMARVRIGERTLVAAGVQRLTEGDSFDARLGIEGDAVFLVPERGRIDAGSVSVFESFGIPETPLSAFVVSFFRIVGMRLDGAQLRAVIAAASRFPGKERRAAEAAAILLERGIEADEATVERMLRIMEGAPAVPGDGASRDDTARDGAARDGAARDDAADRDRDFCAFVNHKMGRSLHWIVIPFRRDFAETPCSGSIRFLIDTAVDRRSENPPRLSRMTVLAGTHEWEFSLSPGACEYSVNPEFPPVVFGQLVVYLRRCLADAGITSVSAVNSVGSLADGVKSIDLEI